LRVTTDAKEEMKREILAKQEHTYMARRYDYLALVGGSEVNYKPTDSKEILQLEHEYMKI
jgi:hypothetical protein